MRDPRIRDAQRRAKALLHRCGVRAPEHVVVEAFAARLGVELVEAPLDGATAQLVRIGARTVIFVAERVTDPAARRFSIAHELGHLLLEHPSRAPDELCRPFGSGPRVLHDRDYEAEANAFASELLMPSELLLRACEVSPVDLQVPRRIARDYHVSILASARRFTELASERCAAVFSARREVKWFAPSATFTRDIARGKRLDSASLAFDYFATGAIPDEPQPVPADAWLETSAEVEIVEHSIFSAELGTVLSMLWIPERSAPRLGML
ncbi:MAG: ImmA/IrrE family metallo-endopeptidase [Kofleriaceae bacterium]|nr:ImmA/IrrE family metallo-endopeptidase [Kofleriaceae bacterium]